MKSYEQDIFSSGLEQDDNSGPGLFIKSVGIFRSLGNFYFEQVSHFCSFHFITDGAGVFDNDGRKYTVRKGELFIFTPGMHVKYYDFPESPWKYIWFVLCGKDIEWAFRKTGVNTALPFFTDLSAPFRNFIRKLSVDFRGGNFPHTYPVNAAWECVRFLSEHINRASPGNNLLKPGLAQMCKTIIDSQKEGITGVDELAGEFKVDRTTLFRVFKKTYGISPKDYIDNSRFEKACGLLKYSESPVKEIAYLCGFQKHDYFSAVFKKRFGATPSAWRALNSSENGTEKPR